MPHITPPPPNPWTHPVYLLRLRVRCGSHNVWMDPTDNPTRDNVWNPKWRLYILYNRFFFNFVPAKLLIFITLAYLCTNCSPVHTQQSVEIKIFCSISSHGCRLRSLLLPFHLEDVIYFLLSVLISHCTFHFSSPFSGFLLTDSVPVLRQSIWLHDICCFRWTLNPTNSQNVIIYSRTLSTNYLGL